ncbi:MAG: NPCBM/NEW2 domain-containing protein, partial [Thermoguttaceae bacterium]|nr:NPCBM/NEW2 domain-containing protein [Thermoguttaceae bacterium]
MSCPARLSVLLASLVLLASVSQSVAIAESGGYVKCGTWAETMLATRAACLKRLSELPPSAGARPVAIGPIRGDGPGERVSVDVAGWQWLRLTSTVEQGAGNCHIWGEARLIAADGSETRLSSLEPAAVSVGWGELLKDKNWKGQPLQVGQRPFSHGIWVHGDSDVCYPLEGKYQRFEAWVGMDAARATGAARFRVHFDRPDIVADAWRKIAVEFPLESRWFAQDMGKGGPTPWFNDDRGNLSRKLVQQVLAQLGPRAEALQEECNELRRTDDAADARWLDLYTRACRCRECAESLDRIPLVELRTALEAEMATLAQAKVSAADAKWDALLSRLRLIAGAMPEGREVALAGLRSSIENLSQAMPDRFDSRDSLIARLDEAAPPWQTAIAAAVQGDAAATAKLPDVVREIGDFRGQIIRSFKGMSEFLAQPACSAMLEEWERQHAALEHDLGRRGHFAQVAAETFRTEALVLDSDRDPLDIVLRRTAALLENLRVTEAGPALGDSERQLRELQAAAAAIDPAQREARFALFADACRVRREIAFANPLLRFDDVLFIKRHRAVYNHMCDQYYGITARPGGGLYVIADAFGARPEVRNLLADSLVENGRLKGQRLSGGTGEVVPMSYDGVGNLNAPEGLEGGTFLSPDLSFDARSILFAYVEGRGDKGHDHHVDPTRGHWDPGRCYHIFRVNADGTNLVQLTDGTFNDFDPCWLPNGRIAFMS